MTKQIKTRWSTVLKSGSRALEVVRDAVLHVREHGDTSLLANMIDQAERADMKIYGQRVRLLTGAIFTAAKIRKNKDGGLSISRGDEFDEVAMLALEAFCDDKVSLIGTKVRDRFGEEKVALTVSEQVDARATALAKWIIKTNGVSIGDFNKALSAAHAKQAAAALKAAA